MFVVPCKSALLLLDSTVISAGDCHVARCAPKNQRGKAHIQVSTNAGGGVCDVGTECLLAKTDDREGGCYVGTVCLITRI